MTNHVWIEGWCATGLTAEIEQRLGPVAWATLGRYSRLAFPCRACGADLPQPLEERVTNEIDFQMQRAQEWVRRAYLFFFKCSLCGERTGLVITEAEPWNLDDDHDEEELSS
jgi:hypothetical protein